MKTTHASTGAQLALIYFYTGTYAADFSIYVVNGKLVAQTGCKTIESTRSKRN